ncbi:MAG: hypothetical protein ABIM74_04355 [candidate division WOR-3 bacterium]
MSGIIIFVALGQTLWSKGYGWEGWDPYMNEAAFSLIQTTDGGYAVAGYEESNGFENLMLLKLSQDGTREWCRWLSGNNHRAVSVLQLSDGSLLVCGQESPFFYWNFLLAKVSSSGSLQWIKTYSLANRNIYAEDLIQSSASDFLVAGTFGGNNWDIALAKLSSSGGINWTKAYGGSGEDYGYSVAKAVDNSGYAITGYTKSFGDPKGDVIVIKVGTDGTVIWAKTYGGTNYDAGHSITGTSDGGFLVVGTTYSFGAGQNDILVLKVASDGALEWAKSFGTSGYEWGYSGIQLSGGDYVVAGGNGGVALRIGPDGTLRWQKRFPASPSGWWHFRDVIQASDGTLVFAGKGSISTDEDMFVMKIAANGEYPNCVSDASLIPNDVVAVEDVPGITTTTVSITSNNYNATFDPVTPTQADFCASVPVYEGSSEDTFNFSPHVVAASVSGGLVFISQMATGLRVYSSDGRLVYCGDLLRGENRINLDQGVYLWESGQYKGKAVVR